MSWSTSEAFTDPAIREPRSFRSEFKFFLRDIPVEITLRLYSPIHSDNLVVRQSHTISVPGLDPGAASRLRGRIPGGRGGAARSQWIRLCLQCRGRAGVETGSGVAEAKP